jgi:hypothetical protein
MGRDTRRLICLAQLSEALDALSRPAEIKFAVRS